MSALDDRISPPYVDVFDVLPVGVAAQLCELPQCPAVANPMIPPAVTENALVQDDVATPLEPLLRHPQVCPSSRIG